MRGHVLGVTLVLAGSLTLWGADGPQSPSGASGGAGAKREEGAIVRFDNGATAILQPIAGIDQVAVEAIYDVGFFDEPKGMTQAAHLLEHLACDAPTKSYRLNESYEELRQLGIINAETLPAWTHFDYVVPSGQVELVLKVETERLTSLDITREALAQEIPRVNAKVDSIENNPQTGMANYAFMAFSHAWHYGETKIAIRSGLERIVSDRLRQLRSSFYRPDRLTLVIVGGFDVARTKRSLAQTIGAIAAADRTPEMPVDWENVPAELSIEWDSPVSAICWYYPPPSDPAERLVLSYLGTLETQALAEDAGLRKSAEMAFSSSIQWPVERLPFFFYAAAKPDVPLERLQTALAGALRKFLSVSGNERAKQLREMAPQWIKALEVESPKRFHAAIDALAKQMGGDRKLATATLLGQMAINQFVLGRLADGVADGGLAQVKKMTADEIKAVVDRALAPERRRLIRVQPREGIPTRVATAPEQQKPATPDSVTQNAAFARHLALCDKLSLPLPDPAGFPELYAALADFDAEKFAEARKKFLALPQTWLESQFFKLRAAQCLLFTGEFEQALAEFEAVARTHSDVYYPEPVDALRRLAGFERLAKPIQDRVLDAERIRVGLKRQLAKPEGSQFPQPQLWQEWAAQAFGALRPYDVERFSKTLRSAKEALAPEEFRDVVLDGLNELCHRIFYLAQSESGSPQDYEKQVDRVLKSAVEWWGSGDKGSVSAQGANAQFLYVCAKLTWLEAGIVSMKPDGSQETYDQLATRAGEMFIQADDDSQAPQFVHLGAAYLQLQAEAGNLAPQELEQELNGFLDRFPKSALAPNMILKMINIYGEAQDLGRTTHWIDYLGAHFPGTPEADQIASLREEFGIDAQSSGREPAPTAPEPGPDAENASAKSTKGQGNLELIVGIGILLIVATAGLWVWIGGRESSRRSRKRG